MIKLFGIPNCGTVKNDQSALVLMLEKPDVIKRPVLEKNGKVLATGFNENVYKNLKL